MKILRYLCIVAALIVLPVAAHAESRTSWSFLGGQVGPEWRINGQATTTAEIGGLRIIAQEDARIFREVNAGHRIDGVAITYLAIRDTQAVLLWHVPGAPPDQVVQLPFVFSATTVPSAVELDVRWFPEWDTHPDLVGLIFPKGADVQLLRIDLVGWNLLEKAWAAVRSYWTFDAFTPYSVNFLWGPLFTPTPFARAELFRELPPRGTYANAVWYAALLLVIAVALVARIVLKNRRVATIAVLSVLGVLWILSDVRMTAEVLSYAAADITNTWSRPMEDRSFRERGDFPVFLETVKPLVTDRGRYIFMTQYPYPLLGLMRYHTYPAAPAAPEAAKEGVDTWVFYDRPDITVSEDGRLMMDGNPISPPGEVLQAFRPGTFVFRTH